MEKEKKLSKVSKIIANLLTFVGFAVLIAGVGFFLYVNKSVIVDYAGFVTALSLSLLSFPLAYLFMSLFKKGKKGTLIIGIILSIVSLALFLYLLIQTQIIDYFQPLSLSTTSTILLIAGVALMLVGVVVLLFTKDKKKVLATSLMLTILMSSALTWAFTQDYGEFSNVEKRTVLFKENEAGYKTFRIPSLYAVDKAKVGGTLENDLLYAFSEGRINSSRDKGDIDIVYKVSSDLGETWSEVKKLLSFNEEVGKYGNATVVFNRDTNSFHMLYMKASEKDNYHYSSYQCLLDIQSDYSLKVKEGSEKLISTKKDTSNEGGGSDGVRTDTLMIGPGKGAFTSNGDKGIIVVPCSNDKHSFVIYSLDDGLTWNNLDVENEKRSAGLGNECESIFVNNKLVMVVRENRGCSTFHKEQYLRFSVSSDYGKTWEKKTVNSVLKTPICMASVDNYMGDLLVAYQDDFNTRANLSIAIYKDGSFKNIPLYYGASGYCSVVVDSDNNIFVLAELGKVNYNENLEFLKVDKNSL